MSLNFNEKNERKERRKMTTLKTPATDKVRLEVLTTTKYSDSSMANAKRAPAPTLKAVLRAWGPCSDPYSKQLLAT